MELWVRGGAAGIAVAARAGLRLTVAGGRLLIPMRVIVGLLLLILIVARLLLAFADEPVDDESDEGKACDTGQSRHDAGENGGGDIQTDQQFDDIALALVTRSRAAQQEKDDEKYKK